MRYSTRKNTPGDYGYRCKACGNIAFAFKKDEPIPEVGDYLEDVEVAQRGPNASLRRSQHICQHCTAPVTAVGGQLDMDCVVHIDKFAAHLEKRVNSQFPTHRGRNVPRFKVDREYMGCQVFEDELEPEVIVPEVVLEDPKTPAAQKAKAKKKADKAPKGASDAVGDAVDG